MKDKTLTTTLQIGDPRGIHCRPAALLAHRLKTEAPDAFVVLRTAEGREANAKAISELYILGARHSGTVEITCSGPDADRAMEIVREVTERPAPTRPEVLAAIPEDTGGDLGSMRRHISRVALREREREERGEVQEWKSPGGCLFELTDERCEDTKLEDAEEALAFDPDNEELQREAAEAYRAWKALGEAIRHRPLFPNGGPLPGGKS